MSQWDLTTADIEGIRFTLRELESASGIGIDEQSLSVETEREHIIRRWMNALDKGIQGILTFARDVSGFTELPTGDQIKLMKSKQFGQITRKIGNQKLITGKPVSVRLKNIKHSLPVTETVDN